MAELRDYGWYQSEYPSRNDTTVLVAATDDQTLITAKSANHQIFVQRVKVTITTYAAVTWLFKDSAGTPVPIWLISIPAAAVALPSESNSMIADFGPEGIPLSIGKNFLLDVSAAGAAGTVQVEAYERLMGVISDRAGATLQ